MEILIVARLLRNSQILRLLFEKEATSEGMTTHSGLGSLGHEHITFPPLSSCPAYRQNNFCIISAVVDQIPSQVIRYLGKMRQSRVLRHMNQLRPDPLALCLAY